MEISPNSTIAQYTIVSKIGEGGMGEVWRARDTRLGRDVAIKFLPANFAANRDRLNRFEQEARATSALNHPNILTVHDTGQHNGSAFLVAELLEGEELRDRLNQGQIPLRKTIDYAQQIVNGLAAAHDKGIVHRDLKPENLFITNDERVKILDFGLAKLSETETATGPEDATRKVLTNPGVVMGTVGYMSPEQVRGEKADYRSDIFSFGAILHEMLSGQRAFRRNTMAETMTAILREEPPDLLESNSKVSPQLERIVRRCLEKRPERRFHSAHDLGFALEALSTPSSATFAANEIPKAQGRWSQREIWLSVAAVVCLLGLLAALPLVVSHLRESTNEARALKFSVLLPERTRLGGTSVPMALSPDGRRLAFTVTQDGVTAIWVRSLDSLTAQRLPGTEGAYASLFWSPDSRFIAFFTLTRLKKVGVSGGPVQTLCDTDEPRGGAWNRDDVILFAGNSGPLMRVQASGGAPVAATTLNKARAEETHRWPSFLPDGRHFIYFARGSQTESAGIYAGSLDGMEPRRLLLTNTAAVYAPGYLLFVQTQANKELGVAQLLAQPFDPAKLETNGEPIPVGEQVGYNLGLARAFVSASQEGTLAFYNVSYGANLPTWFDRTGKLIEKLDALGTTGTYFSCALSGDGKRVALDRINPETGTTDLWLIDLVSHIPLRFTTHGSYNRFPVWSPDSSRIVFVSSRDGAYRLYIKNANATGEEEPLLELDRPSLPVDWSPDGKFIIFENSGEKTKRDLWLLPLTGDAKPIPFLRSEFSEQSARFSPDGKWIAYCSDESGTQEIYVQPFPATGVKKRISIEGGRQPRWRKDGKELFYVSGNTLMAMTINAGAEFEAGTPHAIFEENKLDYFGNVRAGYAVTSDGQRFLTLPVVDETGMTPISVMVNWTGIVKK